jgi:hypothetical protein
VGRAVGLGVAATGCARGLVGVGLPAAFAVGLELLGDARRTGAFFAGCFLTVLVFLRGAVLVARGFLRFALALPLAFFLVAIYSLPVRVTLTGSCGAFRMIELTGPELVHSQTW